jgi:hypothetical protein
MKKTILKTIFLTTVASLAMSGYVMAHHPSEENNPNFDEVDANINDMHNLMIDDLMADNDFMSATTRGTGEPVTTSAMGEAVEQSSASMGEAGSAAPSNNINVINTDRNVTTATAVGSPSVNLTGTSSRSISQTGVTGASRARAGR